MSYSELELARIHTILKELEPLGYKLEIVISNDLVNYEVVVTHLNKSYTISEVIARYYNVYSLHLFDENGIPRGDSQ